MALSQLARSIDFDLLHTPLADDVRASLDQSLAAGVAFYGGRSPLEVFQHAVDTATRDIRQHPRGKLLQRFVVQGPYEGEGEFPQELAGERLTDDETAKAVAFVFSFMVNSFQGQLSELLAAAPILHLLRKLQAQGQLSPNAALFVGDAVTAPRPGRKGRAKAADLHILASATDTLAAEPSITVQALGEVKSYPRAEPRVRRQLASHYARCRQGLVVQGQPIPSGSIVVDPDPPLLIWVEPATWPLPRTFHFEENEGRTFLHIDAPQRPSCSDDCARMVDGLWRLTLRWSHEALAAAAYAMSFWYMEQVGEVVFSAPAANPWPEMQPSDAGRNAATQALYYAILRARNKTETDRAVALYNMYGFGYALGMNFRDTNNRRRMLWPDDLREIQRSGVTRDGYRIAE